MRSSAGSYPVTIGSAGALETAVGAASVIVVDAAVADALPATDRPIVRMAADEATKTLAGCEQLVLTLQEAGVRRGDSLLAVGGGVVQDVATFVASIYMRGLPWTYAPTTLMAMADSCIGGKSSINAGPVKNLVGNIYPPQRVVVDERFLETLPPAAVAAGLAEAVKIAFCRGPEAFAGYLDHHERFVTQPMALVHHVLSAKQWFVEIDEHDQKERRLLNFGHTFGHALEVAVGHRTSHGAAVAVGVLCALEHPAAASTDDVARLRAHCRELLDDVPDLPVALECFDAVAFERAFRGDKKHRAGAFRLILPAADGGVSEVETSDAAAGWDDVRRAVDSTLSSLGRARV